MGIEKNKSFLGKGWSFPPTFEKDSYKKGIKMVAEDEDIEQSLHILLKTTVGERIMLPEYGCDLNAYLFESASVTRTHFIKELLRSAIINYEPRIELNDIEIDETDFLDGVLRLHIDYTVQQTNTRFNMVYPYYKFEGTDISEVYKKQVPAEDVFSGIKM